MKSKSARVIATLVLVAALFALAGLSGCRFDPGGVAPGGEVPPDGSPLVDGRAPIDSSLPVGGDAGASSLRRKQITILSSRVEAPQGGVLADFPVLFSVVDPDIAARASADGGDIHFTGADGASRLDHEIEKWIPATGELVAWVKIPSLPSSADTVFFVYYGVPAAASPASPQGVWSSDFVGVWHLAEEPDPDTAGGVRDSTTGNDGTAHSSMGPEDRVAGRIGDAFDLDGVDDEITFANPITGTGPHTISAWVSQRETNTDDALVVLGDGMQNRARWLHAVWDNETVSAGFYGNDWNTDIDIEGDDWKLLHWTYDGTENRIYVDGALAAGPMPPQPGIDTRGDDGVIGNTPTGAFGQNMNLDGLVDEVRIATEARPAEWIETEHNNQVDPSAFYTVGAESLP